MLRRILLAAAGVALVGLQVVGATPAGAATVSPNINITRLVGNQSEAAIAIDPTDPNHVVEFSNNDRSSGLTLGVSDDGGATWTVSAFARNDAFGRACCDPTLSWDRFGNLFMSWLTMSDAGAIPVAISTDGGAHFSMLKLLRPNPPERREAGSKEDELDRPGGSGKERKPSPKGSTIDQPTIATGPGSVWITWNNNGLMQAAGARVTGLGQVAKFHKRQDIGGTLYCSFGDIAIGPTGRVAEVCT
jgi:hypothetical protein